jgi:hypothetical protein
MSLFFKTYCYLNVGSSDGPLECSEITLQASPDILRKIAEFLVLSAEKIEDSKDAEGIHFHLRDEWKEWSQEFPDLIVVSASHE